jgi:hypothetical protein
VKLSLLFFTFVLLVIRISGQTIDTTAKGDSADVKNELIKTTTFHSVITKLKQVGPDYYILLMHAKTFAKKWATTPEKGYLAICALSFSITLTFFCYGLYKLVFKISPIDKFIVATGNNLVQPKKVSEKVSMKPRIIGITVKQKTRSVSRDGQVVSSSTKYGISPLPGFESPELGVKRLDELQIIISHVGFVNVFE